MKEKCCHLVPSALHRRRQAPRPRTITAIWGCGKPTSGQQDLHCLVSQARRQGRDSQQGGGNPQVEAGIVSVQSRGRAVYS